MGIGQCSVRSARKALVVGWELAGHSGRGSCIINTSSSRSTGVVWQASGDKLRRLGERAKVRGSPAEVPLEMYRGGRTESPPFASRADFRYCFSAVFLIAM